MKVEIKATGSLRPLVPPGTIVSDVATVGDAVARLELPETGEMLLLLNGDMAFWQTELSDGDIVTLVPAMSGG
ncbi:MAG: MoaD/ThiS family protein [Anaerolineales bacterium]|nr:MoaD/ThiS family protein [Anaerolineales bacterium]MCB0030904.1 MoaD/ThiS family protein [Anaerolineales bacterium]MCB8961214.1 MoaD/ThiS family protein [Ardenticatenales bacterium]